MIKAITNEEDIITALGDVLKSTGGFTDDYIFNGKSTRGANIRKSISGTDKYRPLKPSDSFVVFELDESATSDDMDENINSVTAADSAICYMSFAFRLNIYGDGASLLARKIKARTESDYMRQQLFDAGINLQKISDIECGDDFINETLWHRADMTMHISVRLDVSYSNDFESYQLADINVKLSS